MKNKNLAYALIFLLYLPFIQAPTQIENGFISIPKYSITCDNLDGNIGKTLETYYCNFYYSQLVLEWTLKGCRLSVTDDDLGTVYYNESLLKQDSQNNGENQVDITGLIQSNFNNLTINRVIPITFEKDGKRIVSFSFDSCSFPNKNGVIEKKQYDIVTTSTYYIFRDLKENFERQDRNNILMFRIALGSLIFALFSILLTIFNRNKIIIVDIDNTLIKKIKKEFESYNKTENLENTKKIPERRVSSNSKLRSNQKKK